MTTAEQVDLLTLAEFIRLYEQEGPFEISNGERKPLMPPVTIHGLTIRALFRLLDAFCFAHALGEVLSEIPYVLTYNAKWVKGARVPDLMFFSAERWRTYRAETEDWLDKPLLMVPDLAIEVVSANDLYTEIQQKVELYQADGVRLIWVVDPKREKVNTYAGNTFTTLGKNAILDGGVVLPGLQINLTELFSEQQ